MQTFNIESQQPIQFLEITSQIRKWAARQDVEAGIITIYVPHTTAGIMINENADPDVISDLTMALNKVVPLEDGYRHAEGNAAAHIKATMIGSSVQVIVDQGQLVLGVWQGIFFAEFDGPRRRKVHTQMTANAPA